MLGLTAMIGVRALYFYTCPYFAKVGGLMILATILFMAFMFLGVIVMLNVLIAIVSDRCIRGRIA